MADDMSNSKPYNFFYIFLFIICVSVPLIFTIFDICQPTIDEFKNLEKRLPEKYSFNAASLKDLGGLPAALEKAFNDSFGLRTNAIKSYKYLMYHLLNTSTDPSTVVAGKDGWLFLSNRHEAVLDRHAGFIPPDYGMANQIIDAELQKQRWLVARGIKYLYVIAPNKHSIYSEYLPAYANKNGGNEFTNLFVAAAREKGLYLIDLRTLLLEAKRSAPFPLYYKTDSHWNGYGSYLAYRKLVETITAKLGKKIQPLEIGTFEEKHTRHGLDLANMLGVTSLNEIQFDPVFASQPAQLTAKDISTDRSYPWIPEQPVGNEHNVTIVNQQATNRTILLISRDSFFSALSVYFNQTFFETCYIYNNQRSNTLNIFDVLQTTKPDIFITEHVERMLPFSYAPWSFDGTANQ